VPARRSMGDAIFREEIFKESDSTFT